VRRARALHALAGAAAQGTPSRERLAEEHPGLSPRELDALALEGAGDRELLSAAVQESLMLGWCLGWIQTWPSQPGSLPSEEAYRLQTALEGAKVEAAPRTVGGMLDGLDRVRLQSAQARVDAPQGEPVPGALPLSVHEAREAALRGVLGLR